MRIKEKGFTLIELMIVVSIIGILLAIPLLNMKNQFSENDIRHEAKKISMLLNDSLNKAIENEKPVFVYPTELNKWEQKITTYINGSINEYNLKSNVYIKNVSNNILNIKFDPRGNIFKDNTNEMIGNVYFLLCSKDESRIEGYKVHLNFIGRTEIEGGVSCEN